ncbi:hypothetical protein [Streptomyces clavifer]|uniref:hypothetical protein n=1 Tax=Streptomyces clavifer TaxID=68188 RepID=UPI00381D9664
MSRSDPEKKEEAVPLLARGMSSEQVGERIGVTGRTVRRWTEDHEFTAAVTAARAALLSESVAALGAASRDAVAVLHAALTDDSVALRIRAASILIGALPSFAEHAELNTRIAALEAAIEKGQAA